MSEILDVYDMDNNLIGREERDAFYKASKEEYDSTGRVTRKVRTIRAIVINSEGRIYLQKRSKTKKENPGLYDKTVGGHVRTGESSRVTLVRECAEELGFPAVAVARDEFSSALEDMDLDIICLFREVKQDNNFLSTRKTTADSFVQPYITHVYIGYYDGSMRFKDGESSGIETFSVEELQREMDAVPERFTEDIRVMVETFKEYLYPVQ